MIYGILCNGPDGNIFFLDLWDKAEQPIFPQERLMGAFAANVPSDWAGLHRPEITNPRARFSFTEKGWLMIGRFVAAVARQDGRVVRVLRRENPPPSAVLSVNDLQLALLPRKRVLRRKRT